MEVIRQIYISEEERRSELEFNPPQLRIQLRSTHNDDVTDSDPPPRLFTVKHLDWSTQISTPGRVDPSSYHLAIEPAHSSLYTNLMIVEMAGFSEIGAVSVGRVCVAFTNR